MRRGGIVRDVDLERSRTAVKHRFIEIPETFDAGKVLLRIFAVEGHEAGVPDPDAVRGEGFVHIAGLRGAGTLPDMIGRALPCESDKFREPGFRIKYDFRNVSLKIVVSLILHRAVFPFVCLQLKTLLSENIPAGKQRTCLVWKIQSFMNLHLGHQRT